MAGCPISSRAILIKAIVTCSPVDNNISISRREGSAAICLAKLTNPSVVLPMAETTTTTVLIETTHVEQASTVQVRLTPRSNANATVINATVDSVVSTTPLVVRWVADVPVNTGYSAVQVRVVRP